MKRPDYIPWTWMGERNRRLWDRPDKVLRWFLWCIPLTCVFLYLASIEEQELGYFLVAVAGVFALQIVWYMPRAWRVSRKRNRES